MSGDDYLLVTQAGDVAGRFSFGDWLGFLAHEWGEVNGRTSDSLLRAVLRPGPWFYPLFAPLMLTATGLGRLQLPTQMLVLLADGHQSRLDLVHKDVDVGHFVAIAAGHVEPSLADLVQRHRHLCTSGRMWGQAGTTAPGNDR